jgi:hypothetical protein
MASAVFRQTALGCKAKIRAPKNARILGSAAPAPLRFRKTWFLDSGVGRFNYGASLSPDFASRRAHGPR